MSASLKTRLFGQQEVKDFIIPDVMDLTSQQAKGTVGGGRGGTGLKEKKRERTENNSLTFNCSFSMLSLPPPSTKKHTIRGQNKADNLG